MSVRRPQDHSDLRLKQIMNDLDNGALYEARSHLHSLYPAEIALLLRSLPIDYRYQLWSILAPEAMGLTLVSLQGDVRAGLIEHTSTADLVTAASQLEPRDMADLVADFPADTREKVLKKEGDSRLEAALSYDGHTAAGLMNIDVLSIRADVTVDAVLRYLRAQGKMAANMDSLVVVDRNHHYQGMVAIAEILTNDPGVVISKLMDGNVEAIPSNMPISEVATIFEHRNVLSAAVIDEQKEVIGRITIDEVLEVIRDEADHAVMSSAGLDEEHDLFAPVLVSARRRAVWLGVNLFTAFLASWVIGLFAATIDQIVALAVLMPVVASMGGIAGSQTLTLVIRGLALHQISASNAMSFLFKEMAVGAVNGVVWSIVVAMIAAAWFSNMPLGMMLGFAMIINLSCAALAGVLIPLFLQKRGIDPALAGGVLLTTVTDVIGFMSFLGLATIFLLA
ncbi:magnesium transporter [Bathymodiolus platifrons methanotrophic gill symbiont]|uniref:magnesium transporter n=1 Tax=Bathymodiolus platifrons methanotrophic gill symbiont TaxID=113268 RepID=UPI000B40ACD5|nr:magnesium transporter [Bathymodiolus platifrons methanotrophic gill symbiont]MCK5869696.1 magnesium transporter [Methyloprofundus sp.]TXK96143.1 magnesium transporter [Methylococcaceae bacterium CS4]TXK97774.1 magnesium transporter [Methylococcaceae bacterium CS5]TXL05786.1 magnesium transporter [Methylococcaceae bacterium CS1]TXL08136.1 magnesium transporter [Methylococcaceae bacterium CS3]TXL10290.1 magnesium transporter [Methylococcaceae bacterium CS2]TXL15825.1 magnesium transporter [